MIPSLLRRGACAATLGGLAALLPATAAAQQAPIHCPYELWGDCSDGSGGSCHPGQPIAPSACRTTCAQRCGPLVRCCSGSYGGVASSGGGGGGQCQIATVTADVNNNNTPSLMVRSLPFAFTYGADTAANLCKDTTWPGTVTKVTKLPFVDGTGTVHSALPIQLVNLGDVVGNCSPVVGCVCNCNSNSCDNSCNACNNCPPPPPPPPPPKPPVKPKLGSGGAFN